jgi:hypothetical protein
MLFIIIIVLIKFFFYNLITNNALFYDSYFNLLNFNLKFNNLIKIYRIKILEYILFNLTN